MIGVAIVVGAIGGVSALTFSFTRADLLDSHAETYAAAVNAAVGSYSDQSWTYSLDEFGPEPRLPTEAMGRTIEVTLHLDEVIVRQGRTVGVFPIFGHVTTMGEHQLHLWYRAERTPELTDLLDAEIRERVLDLGKPLEIRREDGHVFVSQP